MNTGLLIYILSVIIEYIVLLRIKYNVTNHIIVEDLFLAFIASLFGPIALFLTIIVVIMCKLEDEGILNKRL